MDRNFRVGDNYSVVDVVGEGAYGTRWSPQQALLLPLFCPRENSQKLTAMHPQVSYALPSMFPPIKELRSKRLRPLTIRVSTGVL